MAKRKLVRVGHTHKSLGGMDRRSDPGSIPDHKHREVINARFVEGIMVSRGGQEKLNSTALDGCIYAIFAPEFQFRATDDVTSRVAYCGLPQTSINSNRAVFWTWLPGNTDTRVYDTGFTTEPWDIALVDDNTAYVVTINGSNNTELWKYTLEPAGTLANGAYPPSDSELVGTINTTTAAAAASCCYDPVSGKVFVLHGCNSTSDTRVFTWDGSSFTEDEAPAVAADTLVMIRPTSDGKIIAFLGTGAAADDRVGERATNGTWTLYDNSAVGLFGHTDLVEYDSQYYFIGSVDSGTHAAAVIKHTIGTGYGEFHEFASSSADSGGSMAVMNGRLWVTWKRASDGDFLLASYNFGSDTWDETVTNLTDQFAGIDQVTAMNEVDGRLVILYDDNATSKLIQSPVGDGAGTWTSVVSDTHDSSDSFSSKFDRMAHL